MRAVVIIFAVLAGLKVWTQDHLYRSALSAAIIAAYQDDAVKACSRGAAATAKPDSRWRAASQVEVVVGNRRTEVALWDTRNPNWAARYRHPQMVLTHQGGALSEACTYDVIAKRAEVAPL